MRIRPSDEWSSLPFCTREPRALPPEPLRYVGGRFVRWGILRCEEDEEVGKTSRFDSLPKVVDEHPQVSNAFLPLPAH